MKKKSIMPTGTSGAVLRIGDRVRVELSLYDLAYGRVTLRQR